MHKNTCSYQVFSLLTVKMTQYYFVQPTNFFADFQGFSRHIKGDNEWHCIAMDPVYFYRWKSESCVKRKHFICELPLRNIGVKPNDIFHKQRKGNKNKKRKGKKRKTNKESNNIL